MPQRGIYQVQCGFGDASYSVMELDRKQVYRRTAGEKPVKQDIPLEAGKRHAFKISGSTGTPPRFWVQKMDLLGHGDLEAVAKREGMFPWLVDGKAEPLLQPPRPKRAPQQERRDRSEEEKAAAQAALAPIILDGIAPSYGYFVNSYQPTTTLARWAVLPTARCPRRGTAPRPLWLTAKLTKSP